MYQSGSVTLTFSSTHAASLGNVTRAYKTSRCLDVALILSASFTTVNLPLRLHSLRVSIIVEVTLNLLILLGSNISAVRKMKRTNSTSNLRKKATMVSEHNFLEAEKPRSRAPPKPLRTFSRVKAEKSAQSKTSDVSNSFNDSFEEDISDNITALLGKSLERLEITPTSQPSPCESKCLREWVLRMCLVEKLENTAIAMETEEETTGACQSRDDNSGWFGPKLVELMEPPRKRRKFSSKFFRNLSPSRLLLRQKQKEEKKKNRRQQREKRERGDKVAVLDKNSTFSTDRCRMNLSKVPGFFTKTFWKDGKKHTEL